MTTVPMMAQRPGYGPPAPVPILQWEAEFVQLLDLYRELEPKRVLELGTFHGGTLFHWLRNATVGTHVVTVDSYATGIDNRRLYSDWVPAGVVLDTVDGDAHNPAVVEHVRSLASPYDFVFVDAGHYYVEVRRDWQFYGPMCRPCGVVVFHDILPPTRAHPEIEVNQLWRELQAHGFKTQEIIDDPNADWGGIGVLWK